VQVKGFSAITEGRGSTFFQTVLDLNAPAIAGCYAYAEGVLFQSLKKLLSRYQDWVAVGMLDDIDEYICSRVSNAASFEKTSLELKQVTRDLHRAIPNEATESCFVVNLGPLKRAIEDHVKRMREALVNACRASAQVDKDIVEQFGRSCRELLDSQASSLTEIGETRVQVCFGCTSFVHIVYTGPRLWPP
jgi:hypothetical protein